MVAQHSQVEKWKLPGLVKPRPGSPTASLSLPSVGQGKSQALPRFKRRGDRSQLLVEGAAKSHRQKGMQDVRAIAATLHRDLCGARSFQKLFTGTQASTVYLGVGNLESDSNWSTDGSIGGK